MVTGHPSHFSLKGHAYSFVNFIETHLTLQNAAQAT